MDELMHRSSLMVSYVYQQGYSEPATKGSKTSSEQAKEANSSTSTFTLLISTSSSFSSFLSPQAVYESTMPLPTPLSSPSSASISSSSAHMGLNHGHLTVTMNGDYPPESKDEPDEVQRRGHVPYILNGQLYEIQTQEGENVTVKCCHCPSNRVYRGSIRSTGNFHMHIKRRHPELLEKLHEMRVHALLERRNRILRSRRLRQCNPRKRPTVFSGAIMSNLQFVRTNKTLRIKRPLSNLSAMSRSSLSPANSPTPRPQTSLMEERNGEEDAEEEDICMLETTSAEEADNGALMACQPDDQQKQQEQQEQEKLPESHKLKIRTVFQRHKMQQLRNHQEAIGSGIVMEEATTSASSHLTADTSSTTLGNEKLKCVQENFSVISLDDNVAPCEVQKRPEVQVIDYSNKSLQQIALHHQAFQTPATSKATATIIVQNSENKPTQLISPIEIEDESNPSTSSQHQQRMNLERDRDPCHGSSSTVFQPLNGDGLNFTSYMNRLDATGLIKFENCGAPLDSAIGQALDLSSQRNQSIFLEKSNETEQRTREGNCIVIDGGTQFLLPPQRPPQSTTFPRATFDSSHKSATSEQQFRSEGGTNDLNLNSISHLIRNLDITLRQLQQELNIRNYIERNRICLDLAKFQFQNPGFQYKW